MGFLHIGIILACLLCFHSSYVASEFPSSVSSYFRRKKLGSSPIYTFRGGKVPQASKVGGDYIELFEDLDYGSKDNVRGAGSLSGKITGDLQPIDNCDPFITWIVRQIKSGFTTTDSLSPSSSDRIKPFHVRCDVWIHGSL